MYVGNEAVNIVPSIAGGLFLHKQEKFVRTKFVMWSEISVLEFHMQLQRDCFFPGVTALWCNLINVATSSVEQRWC